MSSIYYPYFQIENHNINTNREKYNHKLYIKLLSLFCTDILIPTRCLLTIGQDKFDFLLQEGEMLTDGVIYFRLPLEFENITQYFNSISGDLTKIDRENAPNRISRILEYISEDEVRKYDTKEQQRYHLFKVKEFMKTYISVHNFNGQDIMQKQIENIEKKDDFDKLLNKMRTENTISTRAYKGFKKAAGVLYFIAGASKDNLKVCSDPYLRAKCIKREMELIINDFEEIINESYSPENILKVLKEIKIIKDKDDILKLTYNDIKELRTKPYFKKFVKRYGELSNRNKALDYLKEKEEKFEKMKIAREFIIGLIFMVISAIISHVFNQAFIQDLKWGFIFSVVTTILAYTFDKVIYKIKWLDKFVDKIISCVDSDYLYLYKIKQYIQSKLL